MVLFIQMEQFQEERLHVGMVNLKGLEKIIQHTIEYTSERNIFGQRVIDHQVVRFRLAELQTEIEALRALTYATINPLYSGRRHDAHGVNGQVEKRPAHPRGDRLMPAVFWRDGLHVGQPCSALLSRWSFRVYRRWR